MSPATLKTVERTPDEATSGRTAGSDAQSLQRTALAPCTDSSPSVPVDGLPAAGRLHFTRQRWFQSLRQRRRRALAFALSLCVHLAFVAGLAAITIQSQPHQVWESLLEVTQDWDSATPIEPQTLQVETQTATTALQPNPWSGTAALATAQEFGPVTAARWEASPSPERVVDGLSTSTWQPQDWADSFPDEPGQAEALGPNQTAGGSAGESGPSSTFFGIRASGRSVVYIVDASGSMAGVRFQLACGELQRSLSELTADQSFFVIFFNQRAFPQFYPRVGRKLVAATPEYLRKVVDWAGHVIPQGETDPSSALQMALHLQPDAIFLLSDGKFDPRSVQLLQQAEYTVPVHTICFVNPVGEDLLRAIAELTGGEFRFVP